MSFYDEHNFNYAKGLRQWLWKRRLKGFITNKGSFLDLGCGCGHIIELFKSPDIKLSGCDLSLRSLNIAKELSPNINFFWHDIDTEEIKERYNLILSIGVLHHTRKGVSNLIKYKADKYVIGLYHKGIYSFLYKFFKGKDWFKHTFWQDCFITPCVSIYNEKNIPK